MKSLLTTQEQSLRPSLDEALDRVRECCSHALCLAAEAGVTPDGEDDDGKTHPIHAYSESVLRDTLPLAVIGLFLLQWPGSQNQPSRNHWRFDR